MKKNQQVFIFDTTLRDGQQSPGAGMSFEDNVIYADYAHQLGIDVLEAGFPAASQHDFQIVHTISKNMVAQQSTMTIAALCQLREEQIVRTMEALQPSLSHGKARLHTYVPVDPHLMQASLGKLANNPAKIVDMIYRFIRMATEAGFAVELSPEGYSRIQGNFDFVTDIIRAAVSAGAAVINCPDTIGGASRWEGEDYFVVNMRAHADIIKTEFPEQNIIWSTHCHNDLGLALDNSMTAIFSGPARQIEACINGVGERAGNASLEQCIMVIDQFGKRAHSDYAFYTNINLEKLAELSDFVAERMLVRQPHWPVTGQNAARHSAGGHTNAILNNPMVYQPFDPGRIGKDISFVFGPLSGGNHVKEILRQNGFYCKNEKKSDIAQAIKDQFPNRRKGITDDEVVEGFKVYCSPIKIVKIDYSKNDSGHARLHIVGQFFSEDSLTIQGIGQDSVLPALDYEIRKYFPSIRMADYRSNTGAGDSVNVKCHSTVIVMVDDANDYTGKAVDSDMTISAIKAYVDAVNQAYIDIHHRLEETLNA